MIDEEFKDVYYDNATGCVKYWRLELTEMENNIFYDYKNDPIYQECLEIHKERNQCFENNHIWNNKNLTCSLNTDPLS